MKSQIALSINQMKGLAALGVDTTDASMLWIDTKIGYKEKQLLVSNDILSSCEKLDPTPAYTLEDILHKLPLYTLDCIGARYNGQTSHDGYLKCEYRCSSDTPLETAYKMLLWIASNYPDKVKTINKMNFSTK